jgi:hypothetical protein
MRGPLPGTFPYANNSTVAAFKADPWDTLTAFKPERPRDRDRLAAAAREAGQQVLGHLPDNRRVDDLRPPRLHGLRARAALQARHFGGSPRSSSRPLRQPQLELPLPLTRRVQPGKRRTPPKA